MHTRNDVHPVENKAKFLTAEAPEESTVSSSTHMSTENCGDSTGTALEQGCDQSLCDDRRRWSRQCWEAQQLQFIDKTIEMPVPTQRQTPAHLTELNDPLVTQRQLPAIQWIPKIVETPQAQFMETNP